MLMKDERFFKTIKNFLEIYLLKQKNYSKNTQKSYRESLSLLLQYFKEELGLGYARIGFDDLTYTNVCGFLDWLTVSRGCSPQTVNLRLMAIRSFAKYSSIVDPAKIYFQVELANVPVKKAHGTRPLLILLSGGFMMTTEKHILDSQQVAPPLPDNIGISQSSGLDHHAVFNRQRVDQFVEQDVASTESVRQHKDATDLVCQPDSVRQCLIRRLTPLECERLQGFPDGWTDIATASDSARYKALGNSVAIPCVTFVLRGIAAVLRMVE